MVKSIKVPCPYCGKSTGLWWYNELQEYRSFCEACQQLVRCSVYKNHLVLKRSPKQRNDMLSNQPILIISDYDQKKKR